MENLGKTREFRFPEMLGALILGVVSFCVCLVCLLLLFVCFCFLLVFFSGDWWYGEEFV